MFFNTGLTEFEACSQLRSQDLGADCPGLSQLGADKGEQGRTIAMDSVGWRLMAPTQQGQRNGKS